jgi:hypothetical protein
MFRRQPHTIFRGVFKPNFLLSWPSVRYVVQLLFRGFFSLAPTLRNIPEDDRSQANRSRSLGSNKNLLVKDEAVKLDCAKPEPEIHQVRVLGSVKISKFF